MTNPEKNLSEQRKEPTTNSAHIWCKCRGLNPQNIGGRQVLSPLCHPGFHNLTLLFKPTLATIFGSLATPDSCFLHFPYWKYTKRSS